RRRSCRSHVPAEQRARHHARARHARRRARIALRTPPVVIRGQARRRRPRGGVKTLRLGLRLLRRDWRAGELRVLIAGLILAVGSVGTVGFFADRVKGALTTQANLLLGADLMISGDRPLPPD